MRFDPSSRAKLTRHDLGRFAGASLFDAVGRALSEAECLPRKELFEAWEMARRVRRHFRGGRVVDLACGHGLLGQLMLVLDGTSSAMIAADVRLPASAGGVRDAMARAFPRIAGAVELRAAALADVPLDAGDLVVSAHACGALTDEILRRAAAARARVAVLPCCHDARAGDRAGLDGWLDPALAIDVARANRLASQGYAVRTLAIPAAITAKNRLLLGAPAGAVVREAAGR